MAGYTIGQGLASAGDSFRSGMEAEVAKQEEEKKREEAKRQFDAEMALKKALFDAQYGIETPDTTETVTPAADAVYKTESIMTDPGRTEQVEGDTISLPASYMPTDQELKDFIVKQGGDPSALFDADGNFTPGDSDIKARILKQYMDANGTVKKSDIETSAADEVAKAKATADALRKIAPKRPGEAINADYQEGVNAGELKVPTQGEAIAKKLAEYMGKGYTPDMVDSVTAPTYENVQTLVTPAQEAVTRIVKGTPEGTERARTRQAQEQLNMQIKSEIQKMEQDLRGALEDPVNIQGVSVMPIPMKKADGTYMTDQFGNVVWDKDAMLAEAKKRLGELDALARYAERDRTPPKDDSTDVAKFYKKTADGKGYEINGEVAFPVMSQILKSATGDPSMDLAALTAKVAAIKDPTNVKADRDALDQVKKYIAAAAASADRLLAGNVPAGRDAVKDVYDYLVGLNPILAKELGPLPPPEKRVRFFAKFFAPAYDPTTIPNFDKLSVGGRLFSVKTFAEAKDPNSIKINTDGSFTVDGQSYDRDGYKVGAGTVSPKITNFDKLSSQLKAVVGALAAQGHSIIINDDGSYSDNGKKYDKYGIAK